MAFRLYVQHFIVLFLFAHTWAEYQRADRHLRSHIQKLCRVLMAFILSLNIATYLFPMLTYVQNKQREKLHKICRCSLRIRKNKKKQQQKLFAELQKTSSSHHAYIWKFGDEPILCPQITTKHYARTSTTQPHSHTTDKTAKANKSVRKCTGRNKSNFMFPKFITFRIVSDSN